MGSECTPDEREFRYLTFYQAIHDIEKDIKKELKNPDMKDKKYSPIALVSQAICYKHKFLLKNEFSIEIGIQKENFRYYSTPKKRRKIKHL